MPVRTGCASDRIAHSSFLSVVLNEEMVLFWKDLEVLYSAYKLGKDKTGFVSLLKQRAKGLGLGCDFHVSL